MPLQTFSGRRASQHEEELAAFIELLQRRRVRSYLEIGARHGDTFHEVMRNLEPGSKGLAVDLPGGAWGVGSSVNALRRARDDLRAKGYTARVLLGDSGELDIAQRVRELGPFDAVLIDGDHRYDGVKRDWENYAPMAPLVAFHDIAGEGQVQPTSGFTVEVPRLWRELRAGRLHVELVAPGSTMGIGVLL